MGSTVAPTLAPASDDDGRDGELRISSLACFSHCLLGNDQRASAPSQFFGAKICDALLSLFEEKEREKKQQQRLPTLADVPRSTMSRELEL